MDEVCSVTCQPCEYLLHFIVDTAELRVYVFTEDDRLYIIRVLLFFIGGIYARPLDFKKCPLILPKIHFVFTLSTYIQSQTGARECQYGS